MNKLCKKTFHFNIKRRILWRISILRRYLRSVWKKFYACWLNHGSWMSKNHIKYSQLLGSTNTRNSSTAIHVFAPLDSNSPSTTHVITDCNEDHGSTVSMDLQSMHCADCGKDSPDLVSLKIGLFGDSQIGKSSFLAKYAGEKTLQRESSARGINHVDKTLCVKGARITYSIWEVGGDQSSLHHIPSTCKDSVAMIFMFDLTSRCTLNSVISWYKQARKWNQTAIPVLVGTKFDEFVQLPIDLQWTIASQARTYAKAFNATLFFSSATYNINVNKIFKFITAKIFDLHWNLERNLNVGEPIIDF